ncbi:hypothetical protein BH11PLA2_BH11PLA2_35430 [soil metagenome]
MATAIQTEALSRTFDALIGCLTPEVARKVAVMRADDETQQRLELLLRKNAESTITAEEHSELDAMIEYGAMMSVLQAKAAKIAKAN